MAQRCEICGKGPMTGSNISHAHNVTKRRWRPNIQRVRAMVDGKPKYVKVCTRCIRSGKVTQSPPHLVYPRPVTGSLPLARAVQPAASPSDPGDGSGCG